MAKHPSSRLKVRREADKDAKSRRLTLILAGITLFGGLLTAVITNIDKWIKPATPAQENATSTYGKRVSPSPDLSPSTSTQRVSDPSTSTPEITPDPIDTIGTGSHLRKTVKTVKTETVDEVFVNNKTRVPLIDLPSAPGSLDRGSDIVRRKTTSTTTTTVTVTVSGPQTPKGPRVSYGEYQWRMSHPNEYAGNHWEIITTKVRLNGKTYGGRLEDHQLTDQLPCTGRTHQDVVVTVEYYGPPRSQHRRRAKLWPKQVAVAKEKIYCDGSFQNTWKLSELIDDAFVQRGRSRIDRMIRKLITNGVPEQLIELRANIEKRKLLAEKVSEYPTEEDRQRSLELDRTIKTQREDLNSYIEGSYVILFREQPNEIEKLKLKTRIRHDSDPQNRIRFFKVSREYNRIKTPPYD